MGDLKTFNCYTSAEIKQGEASVAYPNPVDGILIIVLSTEFKYPRIDIVNLNGIVLRSQEYDSEEKVEINMKNYPSGMYFVKIYEHSNSDIIKIIVP